MESQTKMTMEELQQEKSYLEKFFTEVRVLKGAVLEAEEDRDRIAYKALQERSKWSGLEPRGTATCQVIARYVEVDGEPYVLELVSELDENPQLYTGGADTLETFIKHYNERLYTDVLTGVYNRRYYEDEIKLLTIRAGVAAGTIVIPANINHRNLEPIGIGRILKTKINANIGNSAVASCPRQELEKLNYSVRYGADTVMDLSTGGNINEIRRSIIEHSPIPVGTVPLYEVLARCGTVDNLTEELILQVMQEQAEQGVDYMTIHAGLLRAQVPAAKKRLCYS